MWSSQAWMFVGSRFSGELNHARSRTSTPKSIGACVFGLLGPPGFWAPDLFILQESTWHCWHVDFVSCLDPRAHSRGDSGDELGAVDWHLPLEETKAESLWDGCFGMDRTWLSFCFVRG